MISIKVTNEERNSETGKLVEIHAEGEKIECIAEVVLAVKHFIRENLNPAERFAMLMALVHET